jgi:hypothetical protein
MGLFDSLTGGNGLFGLGGINGMTGPGMNLLGSPAEQAAMRNYTLKNMLIGSGIGLLSQGPSTTPINFGTTLGHGLASGLTAGQAAQKDFLQTALQQQEMKQRNDELKYRREQDARNNQWADMSRQHEMKQWTQQDSQKAAYDKLIGTLSPDEQAAAAADPHAFVTTYLQTKYGKKSAPDGYQWNEDGSLSYIKGGPKDPSVPVPQRNLRPTTDQTNAAGFYDRMVEAEKILSNPKLAEANQSYVQNGLYALPGGNSLVKPEFQQYNQAQRDFVNAILRKESGAAISPSEFNNAAIQYFPQPGDGPDVSAQKAANRATAIAAMKRSGGPAFAMSPSQQAPSGPIQMNGYTIEQVN